MLRTKFRHLALLDTSAFIRGIAHMRQEPKSQAFAHVSYWHIVISIIADPKIRNACMSPGSWCCTSGGIPVSCSRFREQRYAISSSVWPTGDV